jgi:hypothetical protein
MSVRKALVVGGKKSPAECGGFLMILCQRSSMTRMMSGIGIPTSQRRMGMVFSFRVMS